MLRFGNMLVADWGTFTWMLDGELIEQVIVQLFNGMTLIMDTDDFMVVIDDESF